MTTPSRIEVLGVHIDPLKFDDAVATIIGWLSDENAGRHVVVTPNINHVVLYQKDKRFREAYGKASLVLADGRYVVLLARLLGRRVPEPVNGSDLVPAILSAANEKGHLRVFLLGALPGIADQAAEQIAKRWPAIDIVGTYSPPFGFENSDSENRKIRSIVNSSEPDLLVLGISPPKQEIWLSENLQDIDIRVAICAGGTIDFLAGAVPRAPRWMQKAGLEWIFRVISEPRRLAPRYFGDAVAVMRLLISNKFSRRRKQK